jgi:hypothetical protein
MGLWFFLPADDGGPGGPVFRILEARRGYLGAMLTRLERRLQLLHEGWRRVMTPPSAIALCRDFAGARPPTPCCEDP